MEADRAIAAASSRLLLGFRKRVTHTRSVASSEMSVRTEAIWRRDKRIAHVAAIKPSNPDSHARRGLGNGAIYHRLMSGEGVILVGLSD